MKLTHTLIVLDLETTGTWVEKDRIIEIAMIKCHVDGQQERYHKKVNPGMPIPKVVTELTGLSNECVKNEPFFKDIVKEVLNFIGNADFGGFNVERFDLPLLEREICTAGQRFEWKTRRIYDAQKIYHIHEKRNLSAAYSFYCNKDLEDAHTAMADTQATLEVISSQVDKYGDEDKNLESLAEFDYTVTAEFYDPNKRFRWWNGKLYMMFGKYAKHLHLEEVASKDPRYLEWILSADFSPEVRNLVQNALQGKFPSQPK